MGIRYRLKFNLSDGTQIDAGEIVVPQGGIPIKGVDYFTEADKEELVQMVLDRLNGKSVYSGSYEVTPATYTQELETENTIMEQNLLVNEIPYSEVSNNKGGTTVTIGSEE